MVYNGVAVSTDPLHGTEETYYVNSQKGEDLVTNPSLEAIPEELLLPLDTSLSSHLILRLSNLNDGELLLSQAHINEHKEALRNMSNEFEILYEAEEAENFGWKLNTR